MIVVDRWSDLITTSKCQEMPKGTLKDSRKSSVNCGVGR